MAGHSRPKDGVASLAYSRLKDGVASLAYSRLKDGVASLAYVPAIHALLCSQGVDARDERGHDVERLMQINRKLH